ncbi:MAG: thiol-disulfide oxidoreductase DCC family protein [Verrucomicrobia bacterium]|nr:thiol-disulfide oxidoreductase DCC family protein [Verrucomicrobiota bacterium]
MPTEPSWSHLLLFDGVCNLCAGSVQFVLQHDRSGLIHFCSIQSELGSRLYREQGFDAQEPESMLFITPTGIYAKSDAALKLAETMGGQLSWLRFFRVIPRSLRDRAYLFIASNRYRFFGKKDQCWLPRPEWKARFVS